MKRNVLPLIVVAIFILLLALIYGGKAWRGYQFSRTANRMLTDVKSGQIGLMGGYIVASQKDQAMEVVQSRVPADYAGHIQSLKLTSWKWTNEKSIRAIVTCKIEEEGFTGIYQGDLLWIHDGKGWAWDFSRSYAAAFSASGEPDWVKLGDMLQLAEQYK